MDNPSPTPPEPSYLPLPPDYSGPVIQPIPILGELPPTRRHVRVTQQPRRVLAPVLLFFVTCLSTFWAGSHAIPTQIPILVNGVEHVVYGVLGRWHDGMVYMLAVMGILLAHEMGHFIQALRYRVPASLPFFIPMPFTPIGTMGAVIGMQGSSANRRELFDIGLTGPLAGLVVALPLVWYGIQTAPAFPMGVIADAHFQDPLLFKLLMQYLRPELAPGQELTMTPILMAGWVGMLITGLNMFPVAQLDGGHVSYALFGRGAYLVARGVVLLSIGYMVFAHAYTWMLMLLLVLLIGIDHPPTADDRAEMGVGRWVVGLASLGIPILCFMPNPLTVAGQ